MAIIKLVSQREGSIKNVETSATTWGELKADLRRDGIDYNGMDAVLREGKQTLSLDEAVIPEGDQIIFLSPSKVKSGYIDEDDLDHLDSEQLLISFAQQVKEHNDRIEAKLDLLIKGEVAKAQVVAETPQVVQAVVAPVVVEAPQPVVPEMFDEDKALLAEAASLGQGSVSTDDFDDEDEDDSDY